MQKHWIGLDECQNRSADFGETPAGNGSSIDVVIAEIQIGRTPGSEDTKQLRS
jgi:hypothetical protein